MVTTAGIGDNFEILVADLAGFVTNVPKRPPILSRQHQLSRPNVENI